MLGSLGGHQRRAQGEIHNENIIPAPALAAADSILSQPQSRKGISSTTCTSYISNLSLRAREGSCTDITVLFEYVCIRSSRMELEATGGYWNGKTEGHSPESRKIYEMVEGQ